MTQANRALAGEHRIRYGDTSIRLQVRVQPDLLVEPYTQEMVDALEKAERPKSFGEVDLEGHLRTPGSGAEGKPKSSLERSPQDPAVKPPPKATPGATPTKPEEPPLTKEEAFQRALQIDRQLTQGVALLKSAPIFSKVLSAKKRAS